MASGQFRPIKINLRTVYSMLKFKLLLTATKRSITQRLCHLTATHACCPSPRCPAPWTTTQQSWSTIWHPWPATRNPWPANRHPRPATRHPWPNTKLLWQHTRPSSPPWPNTLHMRLLHSILGQLPLGTPAKYPDLLPARQ
jgi:hypothetical protein